LMKEMAPGNSGQRPHKLEAFEHVRTRSADLIVHDTDHLIVRFKDAPPTAQRLPDALPTTASGPAPGPPSPGTAGPLPARDPELAGVIPGPALPPPVGLDSGPPGKTGSKNATPPGKAAKKPIE